MISEPDWVQVEWWADVEDMWVFPKLQVRQTEFRPKGRSLSCKPSNLHKQVVLHKKGPSGVAVVHEIVFLHGGLKSTGKGDGGGIIYNNVDPAELLDCSINCVLNLLLITNINNARQALASSSFN